jgi:hypothetical protein
MGEVLFNRLRDTGFVESAKVREDLAKHLSNYSGEITRSSPARQTGLTQHWALRASVSALVVSPGRMDQDTVR